MHPPSILPSPYVISIGKRQKKARRKKEIAFHFLLCQDREENNDGGQERMTNQIIEESIKSKLEKTEEWVLSIYAEVETTNMVKVAHRVYQDEQLLAGQANFVMQSGEVQTEIKINSQKVNASKVVVLKTELHDMSKSPDKRITQKLERKLPV